MNEERINLLLEKFGLKISVAGWKPFGHGHINDTFLVTTPGNKPDLILQRKNHLIFKDIAGMMSNIVLTTNHIRKKLMVEGEAEPDRKVMHYIPAPDGRYFVNDAEGNFWTLFLFVRDSNSIEEVTSTAQAFSAGKAFGHFQMQCSDLPGSLLIETIPNFHNGKFRLEQFITSVKENRADRVASMQPVIDRLLSLAPEMTRLQDMLDRGEVPLRITHNDTKINNVLFDDNDNILCIIDLDTVMPGSALFDFGDAIRTLGNTAAEDEPDLAKIGFNREYYQAFAEGYLSESSGFLTPSERKNLAFACRYMVWEQTIRFLTDYLNGDTYYKIAYPEHNRVRTMAQLKYLEVMEGNLDFMESVTR
ncbi:MAG TPA: aminoglycoside phosphotransferase family protein [Prolixibacteraceae bacterium]|jgi:thiamine kinase-like enzyme|nr:aminoglycoside phosphotransferase family protein [Bacteroidales bacterium]HPN77059.1 aminoglycoside phosphotransferase family protein [Prolixibacteraceae bacterium]